MAEVLVLLVLGWAVAAAAMAGLWLTQRRTGNAGVVDVGWAAVTGTLALLYGVSGEGEPSRRLLLSVLGAVWGWRLAWHLWRDRVWRRPEEGRYVTLRRNWSPRNRTGKRRRSPGPCSGPLKSRPNAEPS